MDIAAEGIGAQTIDRAEGHAQRWPVLDFAGKLHDLEENLALYRYLAGLFDEVTPGQLATLYRALERLDVGLTERAAHTLKGSVLVLGGLRLGRTLNSLEEMTEQGRLDDAAGWRERVGAEYGELKATLDGIRWDELAG